jgi:hypothetical protein
MATHRARTSHVRPRPPSNGRPQPVRTKSVERHRVRQHRGLDARRRRLPLVARALLLIAVVGLGGAALLAATGGIGPVVSALGSGFSAAFGRLAATPVPTTSDIVAGDAPVIAQPASLYSRDGTADLRITVPNDVVGVADAKVRVFLALEGLIAAPLKEVPVGSAVTVDVPVELTTGKNDFTATIIRGGTESESSPIVTIILDQDAPNVTIKSPKDGTPVTESAVTIKGTTEASTFLVGRNAANATSIAAQADAEGTFTIVLPLVPGPNPVHIDATDPAGNTSAVDVTYMQGPGAIKAKLSASIYKVSAAKHPASFGLTVVVTDPTGLPLPDASAFFTLQIPGLAPISSSVTTGADGRAVFTTPLVGTIGTGKGQATVLVTEPTFGQATDRLALTFVP